MPYPKVAIIYLSYHSEPYIDDVVSALRQITYPKDRLEFIIVDNPHPEYGSSVRYLNENVSPLSGKEIPKVTILSQEKNLGFAGGNNVGIQWALDNGFDYVYLHNNDGFVSANFLEPLIGAMEGDKTIGACQSLILLYPETDLINSSGNSFHYLGMGFCNNLREPKKILTGEKITETAYASGAAVLMRTDILKNHGLWDADFFLYHEDLEYSFRLRSLGYRIVTVMDSIFYHKYFFGRNQEKFYFIERNRLGLMFMFFKWPTLLLFLPMGILFEIGLLFFAWKSGWLKEKINVYKYWLKKESWELWRKKRENIQKNRIKKDRDLLAEAVGSIHFEEKSVNSPWLIYVGNPLMSWYWKLIQKIIIW